MGRPVRVYLELPTYQWCLTAFQSGVLGFIDDDDVLVSVMIGKPYNMDAASSVEWDRQSAQYGARVGALRRKHEQTLPDKITNHGRGDFSALTFGISYGNGMKVLK